MGHSMAEIAIEDPVDELPIGDDLPVELDQAEAEADPPQGEDAEDEVLVSFEGEEGAPPSSEEKDTGLVRHLRAELREKERQLKAVQVQQQPQVVEVGQKPTLEGLNYDEEAFDREYDAWRDRKAQAEKQTAESQRAQTQQLDAWNKRVAEVGNQVTALNAKDFPHALEEVKAVFTDAQQVVLMRAPKNSANVIYALGKNPAKAAELAKISDPIDLAAELARLEGKLTVTKRNSPPPPEQIVRGSAPLSAQTDKQLARLEAEADRTGDRTKVVQYKRQLKAKAR